ncbi:hypothetical protein TGAM01_v208350 [Trichoderma gamsii]|uniref:Uncharacterized protein n=1 Tax=Trichoderma gamsii TaxID=398673 RepID=A0A2P4ZF09_9HYPO|nr:hypothetical protein TGAM01_v208350 [Trichoderma gamsii]PON22870.1 hypothetical protein TGAM01_v208350 [Trichoderma gamsii]
MTIDENCSAIARKIAHKLASKGVTGTTVIHKFHTAATIISEQLQRQRLHRSWRVVSSTRRRKETTKRKPLQTASGGMGGLPWLLRHGRRRPNIHHLPVFSLSFASLPSSPFRSLPHQPSSLGRPMEKPLPRRRLAIENGTDFQGYSCYCIANQLADREPVQQGPATN